MKTDKDVRQLVEELRKPAPPFGLEKYDPTFDVRQEAADTITRLEAQNACLRKGIQNYLDGNYGERPPRKIDKCEHGQFGYEACEGCIDAHFAAVLSQSDDQQT